MGFLKHFETKLIATILILSTIFGILAYNSNSNSSMYQNRQFIKTHDEKIRKELMDDLDPSHEHIREVTLVSDTATGDYDNGGDVGGIYHIYFHAYANNDPNYGIDGEISFPNASIGPFTLTKPNPYKEKDMSVWYVYGDIDDYDNPLWEWKHEEEEVEDSDT